MPIYEYRCNQCGEVFEKMIRFSDADQSPACPTCQSRETHKKISAVASFGASSSATGSQSSSSCSTSRGGFS